MNKENNHSHLTAKEREYISFPSRHLFDQGLLIGKVLDFGCGFGKDVQVLSSKGIDITGYDPHYFPIYPEGKFDTILCIYVLNVLLPEEQSEVLMEISRLLKPNGKAYFVVRRDIRYEGYRTHKAHQLPTYQCNVTLNYNSVFKNDSCEIYEYCHINRTWNRENSRCPFCHPSSRTNLIVESATAYSIFDKYPVNEGHALIIPKKHVSNYFDLSFKEQSACWFVLNYVKKIIQQEFSPDGFNIGININESAGQTVPHVHIHLIPRYSGDVPNPKGGVRGVIPFRKEY